jgi:N-acetylmuramoyl-L-alanine amidase
MKPVSHNAKPSNGKLLWILDNGHGVDTPGKRSPRLTDGRQFREYLFNREVVTLMMSMLEQQDLKAHRLVPEEEDIPLSTRVARANALNRTQLCVLVAVHSNAYGDGRHFTVPRGIETYYHESSEAGKRIAEMFQENLIQVTGWKDRGIRRGDFQILRQTAMPAILTENGFYTNREQCEYLLDPDWRERIAAAHVEAIREIEAMGPEFFQS